MEKVTQAYVYKWIHLPTGKWYIGSRTAKGCHLNDGYVCSSKIVKQLIQNNPTEWYKQIIAVGYPNMMYELESFILQEIDAKNHPFSFNQHNNDTNIAFVGLPKTKQHRKKLSLAKLGIKRKPHSEETKRKISAANKGKCRITDQQKKAIIDANKKSPKHIIPHTVETRKKISEVLASIPNLICPHCNRQGRFNTMKRWHFDNCKNK